MVVPFFETANTEKFDERVRFESDNKSRISKDFFEFASSAQGCLNRMSIGHSRTYV